MEKRAYKYKISNPPKNSNRIISGGSNLVFIISYSNNNKASQTNIIKTLNEEIQKAHADVYSFLFDEFPNVEYNYNAIGIHTGSFAYENPIRLLFKPIRQIYQINDEIRIIKETGEWEHYDKERGTKIEKFINEFRREAKEEYKEIKKILGKKVGKSLYDLSLDDLVELSNANISQKTKELVDALAEYKEMHVGEVNEVEIAKFIHENVLYRNSINGFSTKINSLFDALLKVPWNIDTRVYLDSPFKENMIRGAYAEILIDPRYDWTQTSALFIITNKENLENVEKEIGKMGISLNKYLAKSAFSFSNIFDDWDSTITRIKI